MSEIDDLYELLKDTVEALAQVRSHPSDWPEWLVVLLRELERQAETEEYEQVLGRLQEVIGSRLDAGEWPPVI